VYDASGNGDGKTVNTLTGDHNNRITDYSSVVVEPKGFTMQGFGDYKDCEVASGLKARDYKDATDLVAEAEPIAIDRAFFNQGQNAKYDPQFYTDGTVPTLVARGPAAVQIRYIVRRLTPTECARLQGFADRWGDIDKKDSFTDEEYRFWLEVRNTHAAINGKQVKDYTEAQMLTWYNKLHTDSAEYKMWGNGIALPPALYCLQGIVDVLESDEEDWLL
jgi:DNA (cytosine-5)-methyltransferase 1